MADIANELFDDGTMKERKAVELSEEDKKRSFVCCGLPRGALCMAPMTLVIPQKKDNYFSAVGGHKRFCGYDKGTEFGKVSYVDLSGKDTSPEDFYATFNKGSGKRNVVRTKGGGEGKENLMQEPDVEEKTRLIQRVPGKPRNFRHLVLTLISLSKDDKFGITYVKDYIVDHRSIREHRANGFSDGQVFIPICGRTTEGRDLRMGKNSVVLVDGFYFDQGVRNKLYFVVNTNEAGAKRIFDADREQKIAVLGMWHRHPERDDVYISDYLTEHCIEVFDRSYFEYQEGDRE